jgi:hypothetical protein
MKLIAAITLVGLTLSAFSQSENPAKPKGQKHLSFQTGKSEFVVNGNYRTRGEVQQGYNIKTYGTEDDETYLLSRLRLNLEYRYANRFKLFVQFQDARETGSSFADADFQGKNNPFHDPFDINNMYISFKPADSLEFIVGRQSVNWGGRRVFGPGDWGNTGRYIWDAVNIKYANRYFSTQLLAGYNIIHQPENFPNMNKEGTQTFAVYNTVKNLPFLLDLFYVYKYDKTGIYTSESGVKGNLYTSNVGGIIQKKAGNFSLLFLGNYEFGSYAGDPVSAQGTIAQLGYSVKPLLSSRFYFSHIYGSGDKNPTDGKHQTFGGIFSGADTDLYSWMNFSFWKNTQQLRLDWVMNFSKNISFRTEYHAFFIDKPKDAWYFPGKAMRQDKAGESGNFVGNEADFIFRAKITSWAQFLGGYCFFVPGEFAKNTGSSPVAKWAFGELTFSF